MIKNMFKKMLMSLLPIDTVQIKSLMTDLAKNCNIEQNGKTKFIKVQNLEGLFVVSPKGLTPVKQILKTIPYQEYHLVLENLRLICADEHIVATTKGDKQVQHLTTQDVVLTQDGNQTVRLVHTLAKESCMYDLELDDEYHYYYTNGIQSHNTTTIGAFLLWYAMFTNDATVLVVSNKGDNAKEVIERIKFMYESCPLWLKPGVTDDGYNKHSLRFDNGSRIISQATSENSGRGLSISLLFCYGGNNTVELMDEEGNEFKMTLDELYEYMV